MKISSFTIRRKYDIACKLFAPEQVQQIIIGVHGFAGDKESSMLKKLAEACVTIETALLCFDFPAHGSSPVCENMLTVENCKNDLLAICDYARQLYPTAKKAIFATSFGGYITLLCAEHLPDYKLVLRAPAVTMPKLLLETVLKTDEKSFIEQGSILCGFERPIRLPYTFCQELQQQEDLLQKPVSQDILLIHGDCDDIVPFADIQAFQSSHRNICLHIISGADHRFKKPGETEEIVDCTKEFLLL